MDKKSQTLKESTKMLQPFQTQKNASTGATTKFKSTRLKKRTFLKDN